MATQGIKVIDLPTVENISVENMDSTYFLITNPTFSNKIKASSLYESFSGINKFNNLGGGIGVCKELTIDQTMRFNTITGLSTIQSELENDTIKLFIKNNTIENIHLKDNSISGNKLQNNSVTPQKISGFGSDSNMVASSTKTDTQTIVRNNEEFVSGLSVTITTPSNTSKVLLTGFLSVNCPLGILNIIRNSGNGADTIISPIPPEIPPVYDRRGNLISPVYQYGMIDIGSTDLNNASTIPISIVDIPNYQGTITYRLKVKAVGGTVNRPNNAYINRSYNEDTRSISHLTAIVIP
jgi:hypothetical protein